jgi:hypothetical protein
MRPLRRTASAALFALGALSSFGAEARAQDLDIPLMIQTVPELPGVRFSLEGRSFEADGDGLALITVDRPGDYALEVEPRRPLPGGGVAEFVRWSDGSEASRRTVSISSFTFLEAGFEPSYRVTPRFVDPSGEPIDAGAVEGMTVEHGDEEVTRWTPGRPLLLEASIITSGDEGLRVEPVSHAIDSIQFQDERVPGPAQAPFVAAPDRTVWTVEIPLYDLRVAVVDALLRRPLDVPVELHYPDGRTRIVSPEASGEVLVGSLPPGSYEARGTVGGISLGGDATVPTDAPVGVSVVTAVDATIVAVVVGLVVLGTLLARGWRPRRGRAGAPSVSDAPPIPAANPRPRREHVRVRLDRGRVIEGWRERVDRPDDRPAVWVLDVERVFDAQGREVEIIPRDSFVLAAHVVEVESLEEPSQARVIHLEEVGEGPRAGSAATPEAADGRGSRP